MANKKRARAEDEEQVEAHSEAQAEGQEVMGDQKTIDGLMEKVREQRWEIEELTGLMARASSYLSDRTLLALSASEAELRDAVGDDAFEDLAARGKAAADRALEAKPPASLVSIERLAEAWEKGVREWAWWKDGAQWVGTCGTSLSEALAKNPYLERGEGGQQ